MKKLLLIILALGIATTFDTKTATLHCYCRDGEDRVADYWGYVGGPYEQSCRKICRSGGGLEKAEVD